MESALNTRELAQILINIPSIGGERTKKIIETYRAGSLTRHVQNLYPFLAVDHRIIEKARARGLKENEMAARLGIGIISWRDKSYPERLLSIRDYPPLLYFKGSLSTLMRSPSTALIGSRRASSWILKQTALIGELLASLGHTIVSGLAAGCDAEAHLAALKRGAPTVAVLPGGPDYIYPRENAPLYEQMIEEGGAVLSEYGPGVPPAPYRFIRRDRLQSGLSQFVVLMASSLSGGAMHTAKAALDQGRILFVYDPGDFSACESGNKILIRSGRGIPFRSPGELSRLLSDRPAACCQRPPDPLLFFHE